MEAQNIAAHHAGYIKPGETQFHKKPIESAKKPEMKEDGENKLTGALACLGAVAMGGLAIRDLKKGDSSKLKTLYGKIVKKASSGQVDQLTSKINLVTEVPPKMTSKRAFDLVDATTGKKAAESAAVFLGNNPQALAENALANGMGIGQVKKYATANHSHDAKKIIKKQMAQIQQARNAQKIAISHELSNSTIGAIDLATGSKVARQGMQNVDSAEAVDSMVTASKVLAAKAGEEAAAARELAQNVGTKRANRSALIAERSAERARIQAEITESRGKARKAEIDIAQRQKNANIAEQMASPNYASGLAAQKEHIEGQAKLRLKNLINRKIKNGKATPEEALRAIIADTKEHEAVRAEAQKRLASLK